MFLGCWVCWFAQQQSGCCCLQGMYGTLNAFLLFDVFHDFLFGAPTVASGGMRGRRRPMWPALPAPAHRTCRHETLGSPGTLGQPALPVKHLSGPAFLSWPGLCVAPGLLGVHAGMELHAAMELCMQWHTCGCTPGAGPCQAANKCVNAGFNASIYICRDPAVLYPCFCCPVLWLRMALASRPHQDVGIALPVA